MGKMNAFIKKYKTYIQYIVLGLVMIFVLPTMAYNGIIFKSSDIQIFGNVAIFAIAALGLTLLLGYSGLATLGTAGFMGLAAYCSAYFTTHWNLPFFLSLLLSVLIPVAFSLLVGLASLRIEGYYLAIATLGVAEIFRKLFEKLKWFTNRQQGVYPDTPKIFGIQFTSDMTYVLIVIILVILMILLHNLINSRTGRALLAMKGSNEAAKAMGVNILKYRLLAFALATAFASVAGVLYVHYIEYTRPSDWTLTLSLNVLAIIVIGGMTSIGGALLGSFIVYGLNGIVLQQISFLNKLPGFSSALIGVLIIVILIYYPRGLIHLFTDLKIWLKKLYKRLKKE